MHGPSPERFTSTVWDCLVRLLQQHEEAPEQDLHLQT
jgi:hypothetical protein